MIKGMAGRGLFPSAWIVGALLAGAAGAAPAQADPDLSAYIQAVQDASSAAKWDGPTEKAVAPKDKFVVVVSCTWALSGCKVGAQAAEVAAQKIGWRAKSIVLNDPTGYDQAMQTAINSGADAIILQGVDQAMVSGGLSLAKTKKLPVVSLFQYNKGGEYGVDTDVHPDGELIGKLLADAAIVNGNGTVHYLDLADAEFSLPVTVLAAVKKELATCTACAISAADPVNFTANVMGTALPDRTVGALRRDPKINTIFIGYDPPSTFVVPALDAAGFRGKVTMYSQLGNSAPLSFVRDGNVLVGDVGSSEPWGAWACLDEIIRQMDGQPMVDEKVPVQLFTHDAVANLPPPGEVYVGAESGFEARYLALWGH